MIWEGGAEKRTWNCGSVDEKCPTPLGRVNSEMAKARYISMMGLLVTLQLGFSVLGARGQEPTKSQAKPSNPLERAASDVIAATLAYRAALERLLPIYERDLARQSEMAELRLDLYKRGVLSKKEFEDGERAQAEAQKSLEDTRLAIADTERMLTEARMAEALARLGPLPRGSYEEAPGLARFNGTASWALADGTALLQRFFLARFGRPLPISAYGQTALHDRLGFDHRFALDVAVHPDSPEGRALMDYLRTAGIPFIAAWGVVPGAASGAHIHVGQPSPRMTVRR